MPYKQIHGTIAEQQTYLLRADVLEHQPTGELSKHSLLGEPIRRRINRLERTTESYFGKIISRSSHGLLATFESAEAAVRGAREMQRHCALIPQISGAKYGVQIGIDVANIAQISAQNAQHIESSASRQAKRLDDSCIVVANAIVEKLTPALRKDVYSIAKSNDRNMVHAVSWRDGPPTTASLVKFMPFVAETLAPQVPRIELRLAGVSTRFHSPQTLIRIGRDPDSDIVINYNKTSRNHCQLIRQADDFLLIDTSANGTYITSSEGTERKLSQDQTSLKGRGWITLGHRYHQNSQYRIAFEVIQTDRQSLS
jgi:hypothetical protein